MIIVSREKFLSLPAGVLFAKRRGSDYCFEGVCLKGETCGRDFAFCTLDNFDAYDGSAFVTKIDQMAGGNSVALDLEFMGRDALFERDVTFLVYEKTDLEVMRSAISKSLTEQAYAVEFET